MDEKDNEEDNKLFYEMKNLLENSVERKKVLMLLRTQQKRKEYNYQLTNSDEVYKLLKKLYETSKKSSVRQIKTLKVKSFLGCNNCKNYIINHFGISTCKLFNREARDNLYDNKLRCKYFKKGKNKEHYPF